MRYGLFVLAQHRKDDDLRVRLSEHIEQVRFVREKGFSSVFAGQHFLSDPFQMLQPIPFLARLASEAGEMRVGAGVLLSSLLNPVEVAENAATMDVICGGRFVLGIGLGYRLEENAAFDVVSDRVRVFEDKLDVIKRLLGGESVTADGHGYSLEDASIGVRPVSGDGIPIWLAANGDKAVLRAARLADTWFVNPHANVRELERQLQLFRNERGSRPAELPAIREVCVRKTDREAFEVAEPYLDGKYKTYARWGQSETLPDSDSLRQDWESLKDERFIVGSPETVAEQIRHHREVLGIDHLIVRVQWPGMSHDSVMQSLQWLTNEAIPRV